MKFSEISLKLVPLLFAVAAISSPIVKEEGRPIIDIDSPEMQALIADMTKIDVSKIQPTITPDSDILAPGTESIFTIPQGAALTPENSTGTGLEKRIHEACFSWPSWATDADKNNYLSFYWGAYNVITGYGNNNNNLGPRQEVEWTWGTLIIKLRNQGYCNNAVWTWRGVADLMNDNWYACYSAQGWGFYTAPGTSFTNYELIVTVRFDGIPLPGYTPSCG